MEIINNTNRTLDQVKSLVSALNNSEFTKEVTILSKSSIGKHVRHILEFYLELINGYNGGVICYDNRKRNLAFENNQPLIISKLEDISELISKFDLNKLIKVKSNHGLDEYNAILSDSSVLRELIYALDHTVHHLAIIKIGIKTEINHVEIDKNLGVAPSTIRNNEKICVQ